MRILIVLVILRILIIKLIVGNGSGIFALRVPACIPEFKTYPLPLESDNVKYFPPCVRVWQCGGCCSGAGISCQHTEATTVEVEVTVMEQEIQEIDGKAVPTFVNKQKIIPVLNHTKCQCQCTQKEEDCGERQEYDETLCRCVCKDSQAEAECMSNESRHWNSRECSCDWRALAQCSIHTYFDPTTESCQKIPNGEKEESISPVS